MTKFHFKKQFVITLIFILSLTGLGAAVYAQAEPTKDPIEKEYEQCKTDLRAFLSASIGYEGFNDYWKDLVRTMPVVGNVCLQTDIDFIHQQVNRLAEQVRTAFLRCDKRNADELKKRYYEAEVELFYLRHMLEMEKGKYLERPRDEIVRELKNFFVIDRNFINDMDLDRVLHGVESRYSVKVQDYIECENPAHTELKDKWQEFKDTMSSIFPSLMKSVDKVKDEMKKEKDTGAKNAPKSGALIDKTVGIFQLKVDPERSLEDLAGEFEETKNRIPGVGKYPLTKVQGMVEQEKYRVEEDKSFAELMARYEVLYGQTGDEVAKALESKVEYLIQTINNSRAPIRAAKTCAEQTGEKQCAS